MRLSVRGSLEGVRWRVFWRAYRDARLECVGTVQSPNRGIWKRTLVSRVSIHETHIEILRVGSQAILSQHTLRVARLRARTTPTDKPDDAPARDGDADQLARKREPPGVRFFFYRQDVPRRSRKALAPYNTRACRRRRRRARGARQQRRLVSPTLPHRRRTSGAH